MPVADFHHNDVTGLVIAGGLSTRMDGQDKGLMQLAGRPMLAHVLERFAPQVGRLLVNCNRHHEEYSRSGFDIVVDAIAGHPGPLAGLHAGLMACHTALIATVPVDAPLLPVDLVESMKAALLDSSAIAAVAETHDGWQPAFMLCRMEVMEALETYLARGRRSVRGWLEEIGAVAVRFNDGAAFANVNSSKDIDYISGLLGKVCGD